MACGGVKLHSRWPSRILKGVKSRRNARRKAYLDAAAPSRFTAAHHSSPERYSSANLQAVTVESCPRATPPCGHGWAWKGLGQAQLNGIVSNSSRAFRRRPHQKVHSVPAARNKTTGYARKYPKFSVNVPPGTQLQSTVSFHSLSGFEEQGRFRTQCKRCV